MLLELNLVWDLEVRQHSVPILFFFLNAYDHSRGEHARHDSGPWTPEALPAELARRAQDILGLSIAKGPPTLRKKFLCKVSEGPSVRKDLRFRESAGGEPIADAPVTRIVERIGLDAETAAVPVAVDRPEDAVHVANVPNVVAVLVCRLQFLP